MAATNSLGFPPASLAGPTGATGSVGPQGTTAGLCGHASTVTINTTGATFTGSLTNSFKTRNMLGEPMMIEGPVRQYAGFGTAPVARFSFDDHTGPDFQITGELHVSEYDLTEFGQDHYVVWTKLAKNEGIGDYGFMTFLPNVEPRLVFNSKASRDHYDAWMTAYKQRFFPNADMTTLMLPRLPENAAIKGIVMSRGTKRATSNGQERNYDIFEVWCWLVEHTVGKLWFTESHIIFEDDDSAFEYKIRWL